MTHGQTGYFLGLSARHKRFLSMRQSGNRLATHGRKGIFQFDSGSAEKRKEPNMAKIKFLGNTVAITTVFTLDELQKINKIYPDELILSDEEGEPLFQIGTAVLGKGMVGGFGIQFDTKDAEGHAMVIINAQTDDPEELKELVKDKYAKPLAMLTNLEGFADEIREEIADFDNAIETMFE